MVICSVSAEIFTTAEVAESDLNMVEKAEYSGDAQEDPFLVAPETEGQLDKLNLISEDADDAAPENAMNLTEVAKDDEPAPVVAELAGGAALKKPKDVKKEIEGEEKKILNKAQRDVNKDADGVETRRERRMGSRIEKDKPLGKKIMKVENPPKGKAYWTEVMIDNEKKHVLVNVRKVTIIESVAPEVPMNSTKQPEAADIRVPSRVRRTATMSPQSAPYIKIQMPTSYKGQIKDDGRDSVIKKRGEDSESTRRTIKRNIGDEDSDSIVTKKPGQKAPQKGDKKGMAGKKAKKGKKDEESSTTTNKKAKKGKKDEESSTTANKKAKKGKKDAKTGEKAVDKAAEKKTDKAAKKTINKASGKKTDKADEKKAKEKAEAIPKPLPKKDAFAELPRPIDGASPQTKKLPMGDVGKTASAGAIFDVLKNMPSGGKESDCLFVEGNFKFPKQKEISTKVFKLSGYISRP